MDNGNEAKKDSLEKRVNELESQSRSIVGLLGKTTENMRGLVNIVGKHQDYVGFLGKALLLANRTATIALGGVLGLFLANTRIIEISIDRYLALSENWQITLFSALVTLTLTLLGVWFKHFLESKK